MQLITTIHHINFLVRNLDSAVKRYKALLQTDEVIREDLPQRGVKSARFKLGDTWLVLLEPLDADNEPGRHLEKHGEGFFLISYRVNDLDTASAVIGAQGVEVLDAKARAGLADWRVKDLSSEDLFGVNSQLAKSVD
jgi:methylmalonyl-CoA/ethylmalonyl-CoA epimerase